MARDNFSRKDIITLRTRVGDKCSNPNCRKATTGPAHDKNKAIILGDAAHICAASPGGPRYNPKMSHEERRSIENGIWLCKSCARKIDVDYKSYSAEVLHEWKINAEKKAHEELDQPVFSQADVNQAVTDSILSALTRAPVEPRYNLVHNAIYVEKQFLESKDSRFSVFPKFDKEGICYELSPKENVSLQVSFLDTISLPKVIKNHKEFIEHGKDFIVSSEEISFSGSELISFITNTSSKIKFSKPKMDAVIRLKTIEKQTEFIEVFNDIHGSISFGTKSFSFKGKGFADTLKLEFQFFRNKSAKMTMTASLIQWENINILKLPFFEKLWRLFSKTEKGDSICFDLELNGNSFLNNIQVKINKNEYFYSIYTFLQYTNYCRSICKKLNKSVLFTTQVSFSAEEHQEIAEINTILKGKLIDSSIPQEYPKTTFIVNEKNISIFKSSFKTTSVKFWQDEGDVLSLFRQDIKLPPKLIELNSVLPRISVNPDSIIEGMEIELLLEPMEGYEYTIEYKEPDN
ncbi:lysogenic conversion protein [Caviibacterium pharyngocola]|uniref:lysogenic conversion protein n=1 Tax=Caviibacterium pharyngocola TaxID=28159 RepID=UPI001A9C34FC|nr:lysogenic conversion protein [Caviibacterium pharyngocola]